jgi:ATP-binding cassette subfamily C protein CydD
VTDTKSSRTWLKEKKNQVADLNRWVLGLSTLSAWLLISQSFLLAWIVTEVVFAQSVLADLQVWLTLFIIHVVLRAILNRNAERFAYKSGARIRTELRHEVYDRLQQTGPMHTGRMQSAESATAALENIEALQDYYARFLPHVSLMLIIPISILVIVSPLDWVSALVFLVTAPLIPLFMILVGQGAERASHKQWRKLARLSNYFLDVLRGLPTLKIFNQSKAEAKIVASLSDDYRRSTLSVLKLAFLSSLLLEFFSTISIAMIAVFIGFRLLWGEMDFLIGFFILLLAPEFYLPLRTMGTHYHSRQQAVASAEQLQKVLRLEPLRKQHEAIEVIPYSQSLFIEVDQLGYRYGDEQSLVLENISLTLRTGESIALVGPSGSGKTTLVNLLLGFDVPDSGEIFVNHINLSTVSQDNWLQHVAYMPQNPTLFPGTIAMNIALGDENPDRERLQQAAGDAQISQLIESLPAGFETIVGEGGRTLSGGEVQRIALARVFYKEAGLVVLDEPTASLDAKSERIISDAIEKLSRTRAVIVVAHRLHTVKGMDRILVLKQGRLLEQGSHESLLSDGGYYCHLAGQTTDA